MWAVIAELVAGGTTLLLTTQYLEEADRLADAVAVIDHGRVIASGTPDELKSQVGGALLDVTLDPADAAAAQAALAPLALGEPSVAGPVLTVPVDEGVLVPALRRLDEAGLGVLDMAVRRPTLDDVFLKLTGQAAKEDQ